MGIKALRQLQIGEEALAAQGTAVPATAVLLGELEMKSSPTIYRVPEHRGQLAEFSRSVKIANLAELVYTGSATFEQILYLLHMGVLGNSSGVGAGDAKYWTFTPSMAAAGVFDSFTIEYGDDIEQWETEFCMASEIEISGAMNEPMKMRGNIFGRKMTVCADGFTKPGGNAIDPPTVEDILTQKARLYIDAETGKIGATEKASQLIAFTYTIRAGLTPKRYADGSIDFSTYNETFKGVDLRMTFAFNANAEVERLLFDGETKRLIRIEAVGGVAQADEDTTANVGAGGWTIDGTNLLVDDSSLVAADRVIKVDSERLLVTALPDATHITAVRAYEGTTAATHGAGAALNYVHDKRLRLDLTGIYTDWATLSERDGEDVVEVAMSTQRGTTYTKLFEVAVVNKVGSLP